MIKVQGQYLVSFAITGGIEKKDFIAEEDLLKFTLIEEAGNSLPSFELVFKTRDSKILKYFNEGNLIKYQFGVDEDKLNDCPLRVLKKEFKKLGQGEVVIRLVGLYDALEYVTNCKIMDYSDKSGIEVIDEVAGNYFLKNFNVTSSSDSQTWLQHNIPDKKFINDVWMHSYIDNSFIAIGITSEGEFILKDIKKDLAEKNGEPIWRFVQNVNNEEKDITYEGDFSIDSQSGFINHWLGYGRKKSIRVLENAEDSLLESEFNPLLAITNSLDRYSNVNSRVAEFGLLNDNVHENYWKAYYQNLTNLSIFSTITTTLSYSKRLLPNMKVLDLVMFKDEETEEFLEAEEDSGLYYITKISRTIANRQLVTLVDLSREALDNLIGSNLF